MDAGVDEGVGVTKMGAGVGEKWMQVWVEAMFRCWGKVDVGVAVGGARGGYRSESSRSVAPLPPTLLPACLPAHPRDSLSVSLQRPASPLAGSRMHGALDEI